MSHGARVMVGVLCIAVLVATGVPVVGQSAPETGIVGVDIAGTGVISGAGTGNGSTYLWQGESVNVSVRVADYPNAHSYGVCIGYQQEGESIRRLAPCDSLPLSNGTNGTSRFTNVTWPANATGEGRLVVELRKRSFEHNTTLLDRETVPVTVLTRAGDADSDGLSNGEEAEKGYNLSNRDMDSDGLPDGVEVNKYGSNPQNPDSDDDGIRDGVEIQRGTDPTKADTDGDGLSDSIEKTLGTDARSEWTPIWLAVIVLILIGVLAAVFVFVRRGWRERFGGPAAAPDGDGGTGAVTTGREADGTPEQAAEPTPEPLTDEDHVETLLREHGGRMKQSKIVEETEWSKAKVSRLLSAMNDEGTIEKLTIGRENVISLDGHGPDVAESPHDERSDASG